MQRRPGGKKPKIIRNPNRPNRQKGKGGKKNQSSQGVDNARAPGELFIHSSVIPSSMSVPLSMIIEVILNSAANVAVRYNPNSFSPVVASPTLRFTGYPFWSAGYTFYRILESKADIMIISNETFPVTCYMGWFNNDPGTNPGTALYANALTVRRSLSAKGGMDRCRLVKKTSVEAILGSKAPETDNDYRALNNAAPADVTWLVIGARSIDGSSLSGGVYGELKLTCWFKFYSRTEF